MSATATLIQHLIAGDPLTNNVQRITVTATGGTFTLTLDNHTTGSIAYNATAATLQASLAALANVGAGNVLVSGTAPYVITFDSDLTPGVLTYTSSLTGAGASISVSVITSLLALVDPDNILPSRLPDEFDNTEPAIVVNRQGGAPAPGRTMDRPLYAIKCYGGSAARADADAVADAIVDVLQDVYAIQNTGGRIVNARIAQRMDSSDPDLQSCPVVILLASITTGGN